MFSSGLIKADDDDVAVIYNFPWNVSFISTLKVPKIVKIIKIIVSG